jgi:hypothetical protein
MNYSSPFCPDDDKIITKSGKMQISKLYYKMNPRRDPYNKILDVQNFFLSKCVSINKDKDLAKKIKRQKSLKEIREMNEYYNKMNNTGNQIVFNPEDIPYYFNDYSNFFQTAIKIENKTNYKNQNLYNNGSSQLNDNTKFSSNFVDSSFNNNNSSKQKLLNHSNSYVIKLDKTYYKSPTLNRKIYVLNKNNRKEVEKNQNLFRLSDNSSIYFDDSDMSKYSEIIPLSRQNYLNQQFDFDKSKKNTLTYLKQYQIKETQNRTKIKPFVH